MAVVAGGFNQPLRWRQPVRVVFLSRWLPVSISVIAAGGDSLPTLQISKK
jgi:hypothetical protein